MVNECSTAARRGRICRYAVPLVAAGLVLASREVSAEGGGSQAATRIKANAAHVEHVSGEASLIRPALPYRAQLAGETRPAHAGARLERGDVLETGPDGRLVIRIMDGLRLMLGSDTRLRIRELATEVGRQGRAVLVEAARGMLRVAAAGYSFRHDMRLEVISPAATVSAAGADLIVAVEGERLSLLLISGRAEVRNSVGMVELDRPRHGVERVEAGRPPDRPYGWHRDRIQRTVAAVSID